MRKPKVSLEKILEELRSCLPDLEQRYRVKSLGVSGSYVHRRKHSGSDLDLIVEFYDQPGLLKFIEMENYLSDLLGIKVDLVMKDGLKPAIGERILNEVIALV